jgi:putative component of toxin-antitoxin plasmid stabilization module
LYSLYGIIREGEDMDRLPVIFFRAPGGDVPFLRWLDDKIAKRNAKIAVKCRARIRVLSEQGHKNLPVEFAKHLRDGIWELRLEYQGVNYRILFFFSKTQVIVISHGLWKESVVPPKEIDLALERKLLFESDPERYSYVEEEDN